jgi:hypothetical protein
MLISHRAVSTSFIISCSGVEPKHLQQETDVSLHNLYAHSLKIICQEQIHSYAYYTQRHTPDGPHILKVKIKSFERCEILFSSVGFNRNKKENNDYNSCHHCSFFPEPSKCVCL